MVATVFFIESVDERTVITEVAATLAWVEPSEVGAMMWRS